MPTIIFSLKDLQNLVGKKVTLNQIEEYCHAAKGDFEGYDKENDEVKIDFGDTNVPYLWSVEGFALFLKSYLGIKKGKHVLKVNPSKYKILVDSSVSKIRPYVAGFVAKGNKIDDYLIKQMVQLQEKVCESFGRKRRKIAIGVYSYDKITWPIHYKATDPESVKFVPLEFRREMTQQEILEELPKGKEYAYILEGMKKYPILIDDKAEVLSFPPIINSNFTGKVEVGDEHLFIEATGTDLEAIQQAMNIFAFALQERGFNINSVDVVYPNKTEKSPRLFNESVRVNIKQAESVLGIKLSETEVKKSLEKVGYDYKEGKAFIPDYRRDIMHQVDIIEDIAIGYGYMNITPLPLTNYTHGVPLTNIQLIDNTRDIVSGLGYQEVFSPILSSKKLMYELMELKDPGTVEIEKYMSEHYSVVRSWLIPILLDVLSKNKHVEYPQKIFEHGIVTDKKAGEVDDFDKIAVVSAHHKADYTEIRQVFDSIIRSFGLNLNINEIEHKSFIEGRVAEATLKGKRVAIFGEINPKVLQNFGIEVPVCALEINLNVLL
ncbi:phenylalanine--tRNA ligase subunit beta [Nanoarchaeota archaeon]